MRHTTIETRVETEVTFPASNKRARRARDDGDDEEEEEDDAAPSSPSLRPENRLLTVDDEAYKRRCTRDNIEMHLGQQMYYRTCQITQLNIAIMDLDTLVENEGVHQFPRKLFNQLNAQAAVLGMSACTAGTCRRVWPVGDFSSKPSTCNACNSYSNHGAMAERRRAIATNAAAKHAARPEVKNNGATEDALAAYLSTELVELGFEVKIMREFRRADMLVRCEDWPAGLWFRIQLKASETQFPDRATFNQCFGYGASKPGTADAASQDKANRMLLVCGRYEAGGEGGYTLWALDGADVPSNQLKTSRSNFDVLATLKKRSVSLQELAGIIDAAYVSGTYPLVTYGQADFDIPNVNQLMEYVIMRSYMQVPDETGRFPRTRGWRVEFPEGNQGVVDCFTAKPGDTDMAASQAKAYNVEAGNAHMCHRDNGKEGNPYHEKDGLRRAIEGVPVRDTSIDGEERFYLLYASQEVEDLVKPLTFGKCSADPHKKQAIFASGSIEEGNYIPGTTSLCLRMGKYKEWLTGDAAPPKGLKKHTEWLEQGSRCGFQRPVRIKPEGDMTVEVLRRVSHQAKGPLPDDVVDGILF